MKEEIAHVSHAFSPVNQIRVLVPPDVAYNLEKSQKVIANVLGRAGCPTCHSGVDIRLQIEVEDVLVANARTLQVQPQIGR